MTIHFLAVSSDFVHIGIEIGGVFRVAKPRKTPYGKGPRAIGLEPPCSIARGRQTDQSSRTRPGTRVKSRRFRVTRINWFARAIARDLPILRADANWGEAAETIPRQAGHKGTTGNWAKIEKRLRQQSIMQKMRSRPVTGTCKLCQSAP